MNAWLLDKFEGLSHLHLAEVPDPMPGPGKVVLKVEYAALNPADRYLAMGQYPAKPALPHILGRDGVGVVTALGDGVSGIEIGQRKTILRGEVGVYVPGTFARLVAAPVESLVDPPAGWTVEESGAAALVYLTAYQALTQWGELPPSVVLITGASGGVGVATTQLASLMGHTVVGLSRSESKGRRLREIGARIVLNPADPQWPNRLKTELKSERVDLAVDNIGGELFNHVVETLGNHGRVSVVGRLAGPVPQFNTASLLFRRARIGGVAVGAYTNSESHAAWDAIIRILGQGNAKPLVDKVFPFERLPEAFARLEEGPMGKVLLKIQ
jgi:NADPH2:quinone reductase